MKMYSRKKKVPASPTTPVQMGFQSRPFVVEARPVQVFSPDQQRVALQTKLEKAVRFGHNLEQIQLLTKPVIQPQQVRRSPENKPAMNPAPNNGQSMPRLVQRKTEAAFGTSLSDVRTDKEPEAKKIGALAYTQGSSIHFQPGKYQPTTQPNQKLLGHKLTHVVQQRAGQVAMPQSPIAPINADPKLEAEADALGAKAAQGESVQVSGAASSGVQRQPAQGDVMQCVEREGRVTASSSLQEEEIKTSDDEESISDILAQFPMPPASPTPQESPLRQQQHRPLERSARTSRTSRYAPSRQQQLETIEAEPEHGATEVDDQASISDILAQFPMPPASPTPQESPLRQQQHRPLERSARTSRTSRYAPSRQQRLETIEEETEHGSTEGDHQASRPDTEIAQVEGNVTQRPPKKPGFFSKTKNARKEIADDIKESEAPLDTAKNRGKGSNAPGYSAENFAINAGEIGESRDGVKALGGVLTAPESFQKVKDAAIGKNKSAKERISGGAEGVGSLDSTGTYLAIVGHEMYTTAKKGVSGAAELGSKGEGFDAGKAVAGALGFVPKAIKYSEATGSAFKEQKYKNPKSLGRGVKNATDLTMSAGSAVKDVSGLAYTVAVNSHNAVAAAGSGVAANVAGAFVGPIANTVMGGIDAAQGGYALKKVRSNLKHLEELKPEVSGLGTQSVPLEAAARDAKQARVIKQIEEIQKKKAKRAGLKSALGTAGVAAGVAGLAGGPPGLVAGAAIGGGIGATKIGQWGVRTFKQSMRDKRQKREDSGENVNLLLSKFNADKSTKKKEEKNKNLSADIVSVLDNLSSDAEREKLLSTISLGGSKKDKAAQESYKSVRDKHLTEQAKASLTPEQQQLLDGAKDKKPKHLTEDESEAKNAFNNRLDELKRQDDQDVNLEDLTWNNIPDELRDAVKNKAIETTLKKK